MEDILTVKKDSALLKMGYPEVEINFEKANYPHGRCVNLGPGMRNINKTEDYVRISWFSPNNYEKHENIEVFFKDPINGAQLLPIDFEMKGDAIEAPIKPYGFLRKYKTKISKYQHIKGDSKFDCEHYDENETYNDCIENELITTFYQLIGCHPPLISEKKERMCNKTFSLPGHDESAKQVIDLLRNLVDNFDSNSCKKSCIQNFFETRKLWDIVWKEEDTMIKIAFDDTVELTKTTFLLGVPSLLTGVGGAISGGRTLMWFIISSFGIIKIIKKLKNM